MILNAQPPPARREAPLKLVELFALPGSGKSTVVAATVERATVATRKDLSAQWAACSIVQRLLYVSRGYANYPRLVTAARFGASAQFATRESRSRLMRLIAKAEWQRSRTGVVLLDQGFLQDIWSILLSGGSLSVDPAVLAPLIRELYKGIDATIVVIDVAPETAAERMAQRTNGRSRFDGLPQGQMSSSLRAATQLQRLIIQSARLAGLPVQTIDGAPPPDVVADHLLALLPAARASDDARLGAQWPRRISVVGSTGSGKTVLARTLSERLNLPIWELDQVRKEASNGPSPAETFHNRVALLAQDEQWIIDGHYRDVRHLIWSRADAVVWLNYPLRLVAVRLVGRFRRKRNARALGAEQSLAPRDAARPVARESVSWSHRIGRLGRTLRERRAYGRLLRSADYRGVRIVELRSIKATRQWLNEF